MNSVTNTLFGVKVAVNDPFLCNQRHFKKQAGILVMAVVLTSCEALS